MALPALDRASRESLSAPGLWLPISVWGVALILGYLSLGRGWLPHDAGVLGHASERILSGELPHRDFYDTYTGGLAFLNAAAFKLLGVGVLSMRWVFFAAFLLWVPCFWAVARRLSGPWTAALATLLVVGASLPAYPEGMPSWYNLFFATAGSWALLRHHAHGERRWLVVAGLAAGLSILIKIIGLFFLAGAGLYLLSREREIALAESTAEDGSPTVDRSYRWVVLGGLTLAALATAAVVLQAGDPVMFLYFGVPPLAVIVAVGSRLARPTGVPSSRRFARIAESVGILAAGTAVPLVLFALPYLASDAMGALWQGVFVLPQGRFTSATWSAPPLVALGSGLAVVGWMVLRARVPETAGRTLAAVGLGALVVGLFLSHTEVGYRAFWYLMSGSGVVLAVAGSGWLARAGAEDAEGALILGVFAYHALVQIPFAAPIYALYAFPMMVLAALAAVRRGPPPMRSTVAAVVAALVVFVLLRVDTGFLYHMGFRYRAHNQTEELALPRASGIRVSAVEKAEYEALVSTIESLDPGPYIYAFPDSPEVYFLSGRLNPTPTLFDFLDPDPEGRDRRVLARLDELSVKVVVLNRRPLFSGPADPAFLRLLESRYPNAREVGRFLVVSRP